MSFESGQFFGLAAGHFPKNGGLVAAAGSQPMIVRGKGQRFHRGLMAFQKNDDFRFFGGGDLIGPFTSGPLISSLFGPCGPALFRWQRGGWGSLRFGDRRWLN